MRALVLRRNGSTDDLDVTELPTPTPGPGDVLVRVRAAALNRVDQLLIKGYPGLSLTFPHVLDSDMAGMVDWSMNLSKGWLGNLSDQK